MMVAWGKLLEMDMDISMIFQVTDLEIESTGFCDELECVGRQEAVNEEK